MKRTAIVALVLGTGFGIWWVRAAPPPHHPVPGPIGFDEGTAVAIAAVDRSDAFAAALQVLPSDLPGHDDVLFLHGGRTILASAMDGRIWEYDVAGAAARPFFDPPLMAAGLHEAPADPDVVYLCASHLWGDTYPARERVGLYRLKLSTKELSPVVLDVPQDVLGAARVWALDDPAAPQLGGAGAAPPSRPLAFCNDLEVSADGRRIYFTEPFAWTGAAMGGGTVAEALAFHGNGRVWLHDLPSGQTRLVASGLFFPDGILYDLHAGAEQESSLLVSQTPGFRIARLHVAGPQAGQIEIVQDGLPGMCDGLDRDAQGRIWCAMYAPRSAFLTWLHRNPWLKQLLLRLPLEGTPQPKRTGVLALSPDGTLPLHAAWYEGPKATHIASALPGPDGYLYLTPFSREHRGLVRVPDPLE